MAAANRGRSIYFSKLSEQAERYDEMAENMEAVGRMSEELSVEERNLLSVAYKNAVGSRRAAWRILVSVEKKEKNKGNEEQAAWAREYRGRVEQELQKTCDAVLSLLVSKLITNCSDDESKVFYQKMKADYLRYIAEYSEGDQKAKCAENAREAYQEARITAEKGLAVANPIRLGLALNQSVFIYEVLGKEDEACELAREAFERAIAELDNIPEDTYKDSTLIMQLLRDNLSLWTADPDGGDAQ